jgi:LysM repeat protein
MRIRSGHPRFTSVTAAVTAAIMLAAPVAAADPSITVKAGDTLSQIALDHGTTVERLARANALTNPNRIFPGQQLLLVPEAGPSSAGAAVPAPSAPTIHIVSSGEHLTGIAARYGTTVAALAAANGLTNPSFILPGQRLVVGSSAAPAATPAVAPGQAAPHAAPPAPRPAPVLHTVAAGETLTAIAQHYGTTIAAIANANGLANPSFIRIGTQLSIPQAGAPAPAAAPSAQYTAMPGALRQAVAQRRAIGDAVRAEAEAIGLPPALAMAVAWQESGWQSGLTSSAGAVGVMQLLPSTGDWIAAAMLGSPVNVWDQASNIRAGVRLLKHYHDRYGGDRARILAAYYQGQHALETDGIYAVSWPYINAITALEAMFAS